MASHASACLQRARDGVCVELEHSDYSWPDERGARHRSWLRSREAEWADESDGWLKTSRIDSISSDIKLVQSWAGRAVSV